MKAAARSNPPRSAEFVELGSAAAEGGGPRGPTSAVDMPVDRGRGARMGSEVGKELPQAWLGIYKKKRK